MGIKTETYDSEGNLLLTEDTRTLEEVQTLKKKEINTHRDTILNSGVVYEGHIYDSDETGRSNLSGIATAIANGIPLPEGFTWRDAANVEHSMNEADLLNFSVTMINFVNACYSISWVHKNAIDALQTIEEVEEYDYTTGWPS